MRKQFYVYILASDSRVLYVGVTNALDLRLWQHRNDEGSRFASRYRVSSLVHFEIYDDAYTAISREKRIKSWRRSKKTDLIEANNPDWRDLSVDWGISRESGSPTIR